MLRRLSVLLVLVLARVASLQAQTLNATALTSAATATATTIVVDSATGIGPGSLVFIDHETLNVVSVASTTLTVQRGYAGLASAHGAGAAVYGGPVTSFYRTPPASESCLTGASADPYVNISTGRIWTCGNGIWQSLNDLPPMGAAGTVLVSNGPGKHPSSASISAGGVGDVVGPSSSTDNAIVRFDGTTGKTLQNSAVTIADTTGLIAGAVFGNTGLNVLDTNASHTLNIKPGSDITANRTLTLTTGDSDRALTIAGTASVTGTNTGDQNVSVGGSAGYTPATTGTQTLVASAALTRYVIVVAKVTTTFADGDGTQPTFSIGETGTVTKFAATSAFTSASAGTTTVYAGTLTSGSALLVTAVAGTGTTEAGALTVTAIVTP